MVDGIPTSDHNEALSGDTLYSAFLNHEWREIVVAAVVEKMNYLASTITDESELQDFEVRYGALIDDLYNEDSMDGTPVGTISYFVDSPLPDKWVLCDGSFVLKSLYPALFDLIGSRFGLATGTHFYLPNLIDRFALATATEGDIGVTGGAATHTLSVGEMPAHTHTVARGNAIGNNANFVVEADGSTPSFATQATGSTGGGGSHNNMPPYVKLLPMIKALP